MLHNQQKNSSRWWQQEVCQHRLEVQPDRQTRFEEVDVQSSTFDVSPTEATITLRFIAEMTGRRQGCGGERV